MSSSRPRTPAAPTSTSWPRSWRRRSTPARPRSTSPTRSATRSRTSTADAFAELFQARPNIDKARHRVHCHNDLGLAVANSLAALQNGARQVECTINGIGERAGNASLEEIVMVLQRAHDLSASTPASTPRRSTATSRMVSGSPGYAVQPNKAIVGGNAFAHEAGIHQDGILKDRDTYEIMDATTVGLQTNSSCWASTPAGTRCATPSEELGVRVDGQALNTAFKRLKELATKKHL